MNDIKVRPGALPLTPAGDKSPDPDFAAQLDVGDLYQDIILTHSRAPTHMRRLETFDAAAKGDNPMCGDRCEVRIAFGENGSLDQVAFEARGCAISLASADLMAAAMQNRQPQEARRLAAEFTKLVRHGQTESTDPAINTLRPLSGVAEYPSRVKCATLPWAALIAALDGVGETSSE
jgi:nitrogen fixation NifU-like protein